jgi:hypothetical protein
MRGGRGNNAINSLDNSVKSRVCSNGHVGATEICKNKEKLSIYHATFVYTIKLDYNELGYNEQKNILVGLGHFYGKFSRL